MVFDLCINKCMFLHKLKVAREKFAGIVAMQLYPLYFFSSEVAIDEPDIKLLLANAQINASSSADI